MFKPAISYTAADGIKELLEDWDIQPTPEEVIRLNALGLDVEDDTAFMAVPYMVGNSIVLHPPTMMAMSWFSENAYLFEASHQLKITAYAFSLAHGRGLPLPDKLMSWQERAASRLTGTKSEVTLAELRTPEQSLRAVKIWMRKAKATIEELETAIDAMERDILSDSRRRAYAALSEILTYFAGNEKAEKAATEIFDCFEKEKIQKETGQSIHDICVEMAAATGTDISLWHHSTITTCYRAIDAARRLNSLSGGSDSDSEVVQALKRFREYMKEIIDRNKKEKHD